MAKVTISIFFFVAAMAIVIGGVIVAPIDPWLNAIIGLAFAACLFLSLMFMDKSMNEK